MGHDSAGCDDAPRQIPLSATENCTSPEPGPLDPLRISESQPTSQLNEPPKFDAKHNLFSQFLAGSWTQDALKSETPAIRIPISIVCPKAGNPSLATHKMAVGIHASRVVCTPPPSGPVGRKAMHCGALLCTVLPETHVQHRRF